MLLLVTSCLFASIPLHAFYAQKADYHHVFLIVTILSIMFHGTHDRHIRLLDMAMAHMAFIFMVFETIDVFHTRPALVFFPCTVVALWFLQSPFPKARNTLHACLHVTSVFGIHMFLFFGKSIGGSVPSGVGLVNHVRGYFF